MCLSGFAQMSSAMKFFSVNCSVKDFVENGKVYGHSMYTVSDFESIYMIDR